jgi:hypothetical protein
LFKKWIMQQAAEHHQGDDGLLKEKKIKSNIIGSL